MNRQSTCQYDGQTDGPVLALFGTTHNSLAMLCRPPGTEPCYAVSTGNGHDGPPGPCRSKALQPRRHCHASRKPSRHTVPPCYRGRRRCEHASRKPPRHRASMPLQTPSSSSDAPPALSLAVVASLRDRAAAPDPVDVL
jgi:hypothetical protein